MQDKFLPLGEVIDRVALSKVEIYRRAKAGTFPKPIPLGRYKVVWLGSEIDQWMTDRVAARDADEEAARRHARAMRAVAGRAG
jgi:prophage regulatory protein